MRLLVVALAGIALALAAAPAAGQTAKDAAVILVFDASKSMRDDDGTGRPKIEAAREGLNELVDELPDDAKVGLRVYGSEVSGTGKAEGCRDTKLVAPVGPLDRGALKQQIDALQPRGFTPIGNSLRAAARDVAAAKQKTIVLVSDGGDNCAPPSPCSVAREIAQGGVALKIQAVGFQVKPSARRQLQCIAEAGGGRYVDAQDADELGSQLRALTARALRPYTFRGKRLPAATAPNQARLVGGGQYVSELAAGQVAWYAFQIGQGQAIDVNVTLPTSAAGTPSTLKAELQDEGLDYVDGDTALERTATSTEALVVNANDGEVEDSELVNPPAGRYFLRVEPDPDSPERGPFPIEVTARITGTPPAERREDGSSTGGGGGGDGGPSDLVLLVAGLGAAAAGLAGGAALGGRRRREAA